MLEKSFSPGEGNNLLQREFTNVKRTSSVISEKITYLHPEENKEYKQLNRLLYILDEMKQRIPEYLPILSHKTREEAYVGTDHFEKHFAEYMQKIEESKEQIYDLLSQLQAYDTEGFDHFAEQFLKQSLELYSTVKWKVYYIAGLHVKDIAFDKERKHVGLTPTPVIGETSYRCPVSGVVAQEKEFDVHHIDKQALWGTSYRAMLVRLHRSFHEIIHKVTDCPEIEEKVRQTFLEKDSLPHTREKILAMLPAVEKDLEYYTNGIFTMEYYIAARKSAREKKEKNHIDHFIADHEHEIAQMRDIYALEISAKLLETLPFFIENVREMNAKNEEVHFVDQLTVVKEKLSNVLEILKEARPGDFSLDTTHGQILSLLPRDTTEWTEDLVAYYRDEYVNKFHAYLTSTLTMLKKLTKHRNPTTVKEFMNPTVLLQDVVSEKNESVSEWRLLLQHVKSLFSFMEILPEQSVKQVLYEPLCELEHLLSLKCVRVEKPMKKKRK